MSYAIEVKPGAKVDLQKIETKADAGLTKEEGRARTDDLAAKIGELEELMFASKMNGLLLVFQGRDTAGKDGAINRVISYVNVQSCRVTGFKVPTEEELGHDFLWRIHKETPARGGISVFNRSHYEDVLVVRVHDIVPEQVWSKRYERINEFERLLTDSGTIVLKFYLHISKEEQEERLLAREKEVAKYWKLSAGDWKEREFWDDYTKAYEDALSKCSTESAPWRIIPADRKWFRDLAVAEAIHDTLTGYRDAWTEKLEAIGAKAKEELAAYRSAKT